MEIFKIENLTFTYPSSEKPAIKGLSFAINQGEFITVCGKSGCGKSTLLRLLKPAIAPLGKVSGKIYFGEQELKELDLRAQSEKIGFVSQNPDNQIVTDKVWHELVFGLESLGLSTEEIRGRVSELASFFGIQNWFHKKVEELSGGQKQILNLASVMVMQPSAIILDEPTSRLDPIAAQEFLGILSKINHETGTTVILAEHRLEEALVISDRVMVMDEGEIIALGAPKSVGKALKSLNHPMFEAMPAAVKVYESIDGREECPITIREGQEWLKNYSEKNSLKNDFPRHKRVATAKVPVIEAEDLWFRYEKSLPDVIKGLGAKIYRGEIYAILGGNGTGKTTFLSLISGLNAPYRGKIKINGKNLADIKNKYRGLLGVLPQNPQALFVKSTLRQDLAEMIPETGKEEEAKISRVAEICEISNLLNRHPYDLSGGEQQRAALAKILLTEPEILLLDEPTKGFDNPFKERFASILKRLKETGKTIVIVSHDIEFCAKFADKCAMFFDGQIVCEEEPRAFFAGKTFYTTAAHRISRGILPEAILPDDIIYACGGNIEKREITEEEPPVFPQKPEDKEEKKRQKISIGRILSGFVFALAFFAVNHYFGAKFEGIKHYLIQIFTIILAGTSLLCFIPQKTEPHMKALSKPIAKTTVIAFLGLIIAALLTIFLGIYFFGDRKYYFISTLIILETLLPFFLSFEKRGIKARELMIISVLCAIAVAGRMAFYMLPQFKPVVAVVIISGVCFGGETGFLVGAITGFVSNFFAGQGPWTPWQMFALGIIGFIAGILFSRDFLAKSRVSLCIFGGLATFIIYGGIMNLASVIMLTPRPELDMVLSSYVTGLGFDAVHAASTIFFLWLGAVPMLHKLERIKIKYGFLE